MGRFQWVKTRQSRTSWFSYSSLQSRESHTHRLQCGWHKKWRTWWSDLPGRLCQWTDQRQTQVSRVANWDRSWSLAESSPHYKWRLPLWTHPRPGAKGWCCLWYTSLVSSGSICSHNSPCGFPSHFTKWKILTNIWWIKASSCHYPSSSTSSDPFIILCQKNQLNHTMFLLDYLKHLFGQP